LALASWARPLVICAFVDWGTHKTLLFLIK
jgi:hypothetical protein